MPGLRKSPEIQPRWLSPAALAAYLCVPVSKIRSMRRAGTLPAPVYMLGPRSPRWDREAVDGMFVRNNTEAAVAKAVQDILAESARRKRIRRLSKS